MFPTIGKTEPQVGGIAVNGSRAPSFSLATSLNIFEARASCIRFGNLKVSREVALEKNCVVRGTRSERDAPD